MKHVLLSVVLLTFSVLPICAQNDSLGHWFLGLEGGAGLGSYRDVGKSPLTYRGVEISPSFDITYRSPRWQHQLSFGAYAGAYASLQQYGGFPYVAFSSMRSVLDHEGVRIFCGASLSQLLDIRYAPSLGNTATSFSDLVSLSFLSRAQYSCLGWQFYFQGGFAVPSLCLRPGFAYLDNFNQDISSPSANTFDQYEWYTTWLNGVYTQLGITRLMRNGNRIGLDYRWHYFTSRATASSRAPYPFQQASHSVVLRLDFGL